MHRFIRFLLSSLLFLQFSAVMPHIGVSPAYSEDKLPDQDTLRQWITEMKDNPRGPFRRIRWFCHDGTVHPPRPYPCAERGGGIQHGEWSDRTKLLRDSGYVIATVLAEIDAQEFMRLDDYPHRLKQMILEQFLIRADDGWILRKAQFYRGAFQIENEVESGRNLLMALLSDPVWRGSRFPVLREAARALPHDGNEAPLTAMRQLSRDLSDTDQNFYDLRTKLHGNPEAGDAALVTAYARERAPVSLVPEYERLAGLIRDIYAAQYTDRDIQELAERIQDVPTKLVLSSLAPLLRADQPVTNRIKGACRIMAAIREGLPRIVEAETALAMLDMSIGLEDSIYQNISPLLESLDTGSRLQHLDWIGETARSLYGAGFLSRRQLDASLAALDTLRLASPTLRQYKDELDYLSRLPEWSEATLHFHFDPQIKHLSVLEPKTGRFIHDRLHSCPLLVTSAILDTLIADADRLSGIEHVVFERTLASGLRGLNPGLARGTVQVISPGQDVTGLENDAIAVLPATTDDLPKVSGIVTRGRGNILSHVQLLARNLGIPNVAVEERHLPHIESRRGQPVVLAVSPGGIVHLAEDGPRWDTVFKREEKPALLLITADLDKLALNRTELIPLGDLRAEDSGRVCGPKAANLGELKHRFPEAVAGGVVIPFGVYRNLLQRPSPQGGMPMMQWMRGEYDRLRRLGPDADRQAEIAGFLTRVRQWFLDITLDPDFKRDLKQTLETMFGPDGSYGVFVRSDTNVEDLPGFTGAGLNLTVPNVVGFENIARAVTRVWASPFTERAFGWRQAHMADPEHLYVSVLLMESVAADKSGVLVTADVNSGSPDWLTVAVNEGVGGAVAGQNAEELLINRITGEVRLLAQASEPRKRIILPHGGLDKVPASGTEAVLQPEEIRQLLALAQTAPRRFETLITEQGETLPADIEFGFKNGELVLFQIRPFVSSTWARQSAFLTALDKDWRSADRQVNLQQPPTMDGS